MDMLGLLLNRKSDLSVRNGVLLYKQLIHHMMIMLAPRGGPLPAPMSGGYRCCNPSVFVLLPVPPGSTYQADGCPAVCRPHLTPNCHF